ncbi:efflux RND transporter periplasmic adaptor subunit [Oceanidesulfovibrio marinus]|uniref:Efflux RND transporter periplasmic adaptor subunit n=1 Tax=Oceanidesulfovibrio marinus TaxID=370038 RepID=A0A6P1ZDY5_9BACT|nr:efflux RND transporter periplasmic adaptor subunit [Oceanidesulfovibrio marinus]TVM31894.1 efflux RND transporter periplasmic adaptor subunit [Oceanidesulfovibrio marinus]
MKRSTRIFGIILLVLAVFIVGYLAGSPSRAPEHTAAGHNATKDQASGNETASASDSGKKSNVVWTCSMHPQIRLPEPGQCPICFMDLIPVTDDEGGGDEVSLRQIRLSPRAQALAEVEVTPVARRNVGLTTRLTGKVAYDETRLNEITSWVGGRLDTLYVDYTGQEVKRGERLASIYSPELFSAQAELIQANDALTRLAGSPSSLTKNTAQLTLDAARKKLALLGLSDAQIAAVLKRGKPSDHVVVTSTSSGVVIERHVTEGAYVKTGSPLFTVADLSHVWVVLEAYESDLPWIQMDRTVRFTTEAHPGETFEGNVVYIDPYVDKSTRTIRVRLDVDNEDGQLKPGMFVTAAQRSETGGGEAPLVIPASAPLLTGKRAVVYLQDPDDPALYYGREIVLGPRAGNVYIVREGLSEGDLVVTSGAFKIDSAVQIKARPSMMNPDTGAPAPAGHEHHTEGAPAGPAAEMADMEMNTYAYDVPYDFAKQLPQLAQHFAVIEDGVYAAQQGATGVTTVRGLYKQFYDAICGIDPTAITDKEAALQWKELSMLLRNDSYLGSEAEDIDEAARIFKEFQGHFDTLSRTFPLQPKAQAATLPTTPEFGESLSRILQSYLALHAALANDDLDAAHAAAQEIQNQVNKAPADNLSDDAADVWQQSSEEMLDALGPVVSGKDLDSVRNAFQPLSTALSGLLTRFGGPNGAPIYEMFCSMAFGGKGGTWLQTQKDVLNPYYGQAMLGCGEVQREIEPAETTQAAPGTSGAKPSSILDTPDSFRQALAPIVSAYLSMQQELAKDDLAAAKNQAKAISLALPMVDDSVLSEAPAAIWSDTRAALEKGAAAVESSPDLTAARVGFRTLSQAMLTVVDRLGAGKQRGLYEAFCPMAFDDTGGTWVQEGETIENPYFGESMLQCGEIKRPLGAQ